jgi:RNA polymerase sigma-70 factor (ECF subfamily)
MPISAQIAATSAKARSERAVDAVRGRAMVVPPVGWGVRRRIRTPGPGGSATADIRPPWNRSPPFGERTCVTTINLHRIRGLRQRRSPRPARPLAAEDDASLIERVAGGDEHALGALHDRHARLALGIARRLLPDDETAREVVQDAFLDLWRTAPAWDGDRSSVTTWLVRLVRLRAVDRLRREHAARRTSAAGEHDAPIEHAAELAAPDDVPRTVELADRGERVRAALEALPEPQRDVVRLAFERGLTHTEIAERLDLPLGTVKTRCMRALDKLATLLADEREDEVRAR